MSFETVALQRSHQARRARSATAVVRRPITAFASRRSARTLGTTSSTGTPGTPGTLGRVLPGNTP